MCLGGREGKTCPTAAEHTLPMYASCDGGRGDRQMAGGCSSAGELRSTARAPARLRRDFSRLCRTGCNGETIHTVHNLLLRSSGGKSVILTRAANINVYLNHFRRNTRSSNCFSYGDGSKLRGPQGCKAPAKTADATPAVKGTNPRRLAFLLLTSKPGIFAQPNIIDAAHLSAKVGGDMGSR
jgi:hypothetical protein